MNNWSLRTRIFVLAVLPVFAFAIVLASYFILTIFSNHEKNGIDNAVGLIRQLAAVAEEACYMEEPDLLKTIAVAALDEKDTVSVSFFNAQGKPLASSKAVIPPLNTDPLPLMPMLIDDSPHNFSVIAPVLLRRPSIGAYPFHDVLGKHRKPIQSAAIGWVSIEYSKATINQNKQNGLMVTLAAVGMVLILATLLALLVGYRVMLPIINFQHAVHAISTGNLSVRLPISGPSDMRRLAADFNMMANTLQSHRELLEARVQEATHELEQRKNEAEKANLAKSRFLAAASHDLRQPLHALLLFVSDLKMMSSGDDQQSELIDKIEASVQLTSQLLETLLDVSKLDMADITPHLTNVNLDALFYRLQLAYARNAGKRGLRLRIITGDISIYTDANLMERLLGNLLSNAIRYTPAGTILIAPRRCQDPALVRIEVRDNGIGISPEHQQAIFEEFFQVGNNARDSSQGLGLGLTIVKRISTILGISIGLRSQLGKGAVFWVEVPRATAAQNADQELYLLRPEQNKKLLLLGLDDKTYSRIGDLARAWGLDPVSDSDFLAAPEHLTAIVTTAEIQSKYNLQGSKVIVLISEHEHPSAERENLHYLTVPIRPARLRALLSHLIID